MSATFSGAHTDEMWECSSFLGLHEQLATASHAAQHWAPQLHSSCISAAHASCGINAYTVMQHQKEYQNNMNLMFTNPLLALLVAICPWHPQARKARIAGRAVAQVSLGTLKLDRHTILDAATMAQLYTG